jgi:hypothetical protein
MEPRWDTRCLCGGRIATVRQGLEGHGVTLAAVPIGRCPDCGLTTYPVEVLEQVEVAIFARGDDPVVARPA